MTGTVTAPRDLEGISTPSGARQRFDGLDGLRAVAVTAVICFHFGVGHTGGGFLGVDLFFVLSGFLITYLLIEQFEGSAGIGFARFWARRFRRLYPALVVMVAAVCVVVWIARPGDLGQGLVAEAASSLLGVSNWYAISQSTNYFAATTSPFTHMWSLSIEAQFYLVWPLVALLVLRLRRGRVVLGILAGLGALASTAAMAALYASGANLTRLYEGTDTHAEGLLVGALLALLLSAKASFSLGLPRAMARRLTSLAAVVLVVVVIGAFVVMDGGSSFLYQGGFLLYAIAVAMLIALVISHPTRWFTRVLSLAAVAYVGRLSYSLYLWHYPLVVLLTHQATGLDGASLFVVRVMATLGLSVLSYHLIEVPVRRRVALGTGWQLGLVAGVVATGALVAASLAAPAAPATSSSSSSSSGHVTPGMGAYGPPDNPSALPVVRPGTKGVLIVGDSMAGSLANGLKETAWGQRYQARAHITVANLGEAGCAMAIGPMVLKGQVSAPGQYCDPTQPGPRWPAMWTEVVDHFDPALSIYEARLDQVDRVMGGTTQHIGQPGYDAWLTHQLDTAVTILTSRGGKVLLVTSPHYASGEQPDGTPWPEDAAWRVARYNEILRSVARAHPTTVGILDVGGMMSPHGRYASVVDGVSVRYVDGIHWTFQGDELIWRLVQPTVEHWAGTSTGTG